MRPGVLVAIALLPVVAARADEASWVLQPDLTPTRLAERGAALTSSDSVRWPDGPNVDLSYWLGDGDVVYRCAAFAAGDATTSSCWRLEIVASDQSRLISTRRRPEPSTTGDVSQPVAVQPYVYWNGLPYPAAPAQNPPRPRPTPLPTPAP
jgi:hypothetical protein